MHYFLSLSLHDRAAEWCQKSTAVKFSKTKLLCKKSFECVGKKNDVTDENE